MYCIYKIHIWKNNSKYICHKSCSVLTAFNAPQCAWNFNSSLHTMGSQSEFPTHEAPRTAATWVGETNAGLSPGPGPQWRHPTERGQRRGQEGGQRHIPDIRCFLHLICREETSIFHWELRDIHSRMLDCLQFSIRRLHGWNAPWCWQDIISIHRDYIYTVYMAMFLVHTFHYWMIRIAVFFLKMIYLPVPHATVDPLALGPRYHHAEDQEEPSTAHHHLEDVDLRFGEIHGSSFLFKRGWSPIGHVPAFPCSSLFIHVLNRRLRLGSSIIFWQRCSVSSFSDQAWIESNT